ncbi:MAG: sensor domain-containing diguanylate cyclase, partial [Gammaproteobacteria bacterium]|nr:sensor domain-containing diguanylate cyclase [Gammaproteobacteria bacterium]
HVHALESEQQKRRWAETLHKLSQSMSSSLDASQVASELLDGIYRMVSFRAAALFVEQGIEITLIGSRGIAEEQLHALTRLPETHAKLFADLRYARRPLKIEHGELEASVLVTDEFEGFTYLAVPTYSRADEFALLLLGRGEDEFTDQEIGIVSAFATQALVALDNARLFSEVQNLATTDTLTRVNNRRYFFELAELEFSRSRRYNRDVAIILLDADSFREINENYGHEIGDRVLKILANTCRANLRHFDIMGRYGGEDFVIMLPETPMNVAADVADRLRKSIENIKLDTHLGELWVTVSLGVAVARDDTPDLASLINKADMALYEAKKAGRNRVVVAD